MKKIKLVKYNAHQSGNSQDGFDFDYFSAELGKSEFQTKRVVTSIDEYTPKNGLEHHSVHIGYENGESKTIFNLCEIEYF